MSSAVFSVANVVARGDASSDKDGAQTDVLEFPVHSLPPKPPSRTKSRSIDDRYGPGALGPRILSHESEVVEVAPQRMEVHAVYGEVELSPDAVRAASVAKTYAHPMPSTLTAASDDDRLREAASEKTKADSHPREASAGARTPQPVRIWEVREPRAARDASPLARAEVDTRAYLAQLGIHSIYELSPAARRLMLPQGRRSDVLPLNNGTGVMSAHLGHKAGTNAAVTFGGWEGMIQEAGRLFGLEPRFIAAMIKVESNFDPLAVSPKGAQGAMQIMPGTQAQFGLENPFDVRANIHAGCAFIRELLLQYGSTELALAAYNAGPGAVDKYGGIPPYVETQQYVRKVMSLWQGEQAYPVKTGADSNGNGTIEDNEKNLYLIQTNQFQSFYMIPNGDNVSTANIPNAQML
ncbi:MAG: lytic transglycosylase domain-containing protein, partial [Desulfovibrio sp.]|nr:lytic transglycosylase domain-containing protein [Desulfovibrio sp.]